VLKEFYLPAVREQLNNTNLLLSQIEKDTVNIEGRRAVLSLHVSRNSSVGARAEGAALPGTTSAGSTAIGNEGYAEERIPIKHVYGRIQISGPVMRAMKSDRGSFIRAVDSQMKGVTQSLKKDVNRQLWNGQVGAIIGLQNAGPANTFTLATTATRVDQRHLTVGMVIDIGDASNSTSVAEARTITAVSFATLPGTITVNGGAVTTSSSFVYRSGLNPGGAPAGIELTGLVDIVAATGNLFNVNPTNFPVWASYVNSNGGTNRTVTENLFADVMHNVNILSGEDINMWLTSDGVFRAYALQLTAQKRFNNTLDMKGGFKGLDVAAGGGSVPLAWDLDCPGNKAFALNTSHLTEFVSSDWSWMDEDGAVLSRRPNIEAYEATLYKDLELGTDMRNSHGLLSDLTAA
jgi:hypothetical protein